MESINKMIKCMMPYAEPVGPKAVCGTDNISFFSIDVLECIKQTEYGKRVNLQLKHEGMCWMWEDYGFDTTTVVFVSKINLFRVQWARPSTRLFSFNLNFVTDAIFCHFPDCWRVVLRLSSRSEIAFKLDSSINVQNIRTVV